MNKESIYQTIEYLRFPAACLVVVLHAYTTLQLTITGGMQTYTLFSSSISLGFGEIGVPLFFTISGFLFFQSFNTSAYKRKIKSRIKTLLVPYLLWNTIMIGLYFILQSIPSLSPYFSGANKPIADYNTQDFFRAFWDCGNWNLGDGTPILQPYWYIRNLMILCLISPLIAFLTKKGGILSFLPPLIGWIIFQRASFLLSSLAFFTLGAWLCYNTDKKFEWFSHNKKFISISYIVLFSIDLTLKLMQIYPYGYYIHRLGIVFAIPAMFLLARWLKNKISIPENLTKASFFIYTVHMPLMLATRKICLKLVPCQYELLHCILYFISIALVVLVSYSIYWIMKRLTPSLFHILNGR